MTDGSQDASAKTQPKDALGDKKDAPPKPHYHGHRQRLREKFLAQGGEALPDYELLELVLATALPRRDVKPLAKDLLDRFGGFDGVVSAPLNELTKVKGLGETAATNLKVIQAASVRLLRNEAGKKPILDSWDKLMDYCFAAMAREQTEQFRILFLDSKNKLIRDEVQQTGTINHTPVYPREVVKRALDLGSSAIIIAHNHPSGDPTPSKDDITMTRKIKEAAETLGVALHDHVIVGKEGYISFKSKGLL